MADKNHSFTSPSPIVTIDESEYQPSLDRKLARLAELFEGLAPAGEQLPQVAVYPSEPKHYRMRAEFTTWGTHSGGKRKKGKQVDAAEAVDAVEQPPDVHFIMYDTTSTIKPPPRVRIDQFPVGSKLMNALMPHVTQAINRSPMLRDRLFQVNFHTALSGESMVTLLYHKKLDDLWLAAAKGLRAELAGVPETGGHTPHVIGRARKQKLELDASHITERLTANGRVYLYRQVEGAFSQPNAGVCQHMLSWAQRVSAPQPTPGAASPSGQQQQQDQQQGEGGGAIDPGVACQPTRHDHDLLELYCGNGNFTIPLAQNFRRVVATEVSKSSVEAARYNIDANGVTNIFIARMSSEEFTEAWQTKAARRRLDGLGSWDDLDLRTVLVDPPRAGLDDETLKLVATFERIIYISCNPETLRANLAHLMPTHRIERFAAFDQFPYTHHLETGVYLVKR